MMYLFVSNLYFDNADNHTFNNKAKQHKHRSRIE
jgi:hypothetical protein